jgi:hypothetical protein
MKKSEQKIIRYEPQNINDWKTCRYRFSLRRASIYQVFGPQYKHIVMMVNRLGQETPWAVYKNEDKLDSLK